MGRGGQRDPLIIYPCRWTCEGCGTVFISHGGHSLWFAIHCADGLPEDCREVMVKNIMES